ncbi:hypothetical protein SAMN05421810_101658 [Amycolatopsis arida]|uniref:DUF2993 domain-containing protein n=1 Tax=Amycolatopsis arida TaxID=587909 RepID=A0A1I5LUI5_9PSEU|nr:hypothetical protein [Amycolatopsis arida]TDX93834.1 hypothetical protein CLV69_104291 [Amycolatopsis arida]SFP00421.1 hypothetical protein SAMN05421810_101658 [Amycolatopsis arida]
MDGTGLFDGWLPRELESLLAAGRTLLPSVSMPAVPTSPSGMVETAVHVVGDRLVGRRLTARVAEHDVAFTLGELDCRVASVGLLGRADVGDLRLVAEDVDWPGGPLRRVTVVGRDVRVRSLPTPALVAATVEVDITVAADVLRARVAEARPGVDVELDPDGTLRLRSTRRPWWGSVEVEPRVVDADVLLRPVAAHALGRRIRLPRRLRHVPVSLPALRDGPVGLRLTGVDTGAGEVVLRGTADAWRDRLATVPLTGLLGWLGTIAGTLTVPLPLMPPRAEPA